MSSPGTFQLAGLGTHACVASAAETENNVATKTPTTINKLLCFILASSFNGIRVNKANPFHFIFS
jgi:hypothetical protein